MAYVSYETIDNIPIEEAQNAINWGWDTWVPWISGEKINAKTSTYNLPEQSHIAWWTTDIVRSATDHETITWTGWDINMPDWTVYNVSAGSVVVNWLTYFYYDMVDETIKTTTTSADSVWVGKLLILVANDSTPPNKATFTAFWTGQSEQLVTHDYISPWAVDTVNIALWAIQSNLIATGAITETKIDNNAITTPKIATWAITANEIGANAVTATKINAWAVTTAKIDAWAITSDKIDAWAVTAQKIASHTITANQIASNTITASEIASNTITANEINTNTITSLDLTSWTITWVTITGGLFRTKSTGHRVEITSDAWWWIGQNQINFYNSNNTLVAEMKWWYDISWSDPDDRFFITWKNNWLLNINWYDTWITGTGRLLLNGKNWVIQLAWTWSNTIYFNPWSWGYSTFDEKVYMNNGLQVSWSLNSSSLSTWSISGSSIYSSGNITSDWTIYANNLSVSWSFGSIVTDSIRPNYNASYDLWSDSYRRGTLYLWGASSNALNWSGSAFTWSNSATHYVRVRVWWTSYKLLLST